MNAYEKLASISQIIIIIRPIANEENVQKIEIEIAIVASLRDISESLDMFFLNRFTKLFLKSSSMQKWLTTNPSISSSFKSFFLDETSSLTWHNFNDCLFRFLNLIISITRNLKSQTRNVLSNRHSPNEFQKHNNNNKSSCDDKRVPFG